VLQSLPVRIGYCTHNFDSLITYANNDTNLLTAIIDARFICGDSAGMIYLEKKLKRKTDLPSFNDFLMHKHQEQKTRDHKYSINHTPDLKKTVGNLRYLHTIYWVFHYMYPQSSTNMAMQQKYISTDELDLLKHAHCFLSDIRFYLHILYQREENRLLLECRQKVVNIFSASTQSDQCTEPFMREYYQTIDKVKLINRMIISRLRSRLS